MKDTNRAQVRRRWPACAFVVAMIAGLTAGVVGVPRATAADPTASMSIQKVADTQQVAPGQSFTYTIQVQCTAASVTGCVNAEVTDQLPQYVEYVGPITVTGGAGNTVTSGPPIVVTFTDDLGAGNVGLLAGRIVTITIPVRAADDIPVAASGQPLDNTATISADNADTKTSTATVTPNVPPSFAAETAKSYDPTQAAAAPGTPVTMSITGTNTSNVPVDELVITDPLDPAAEPNPFDYLDIVDLGTVTPPAGAEQVQVDAYVDGAWVTGTPGPPPAVLPDVSPAAVADIAGLRFTFISTDGADIQPGASADVNLDLEQNSSVSTIAPGTNVTVLNTATTTVSNPDGSATSPPADAEYQIGLTPIDVIAHKSIDPGTVHAGDTAVVTISGTNNSQVPLDSMTLTEPAAGTFAPGIVPAGFGTDGNGAGISWPTGASEVSVVYSCTVPPSPRAPATTDVVNTLPAPPPTCGEVTKMVVTFTGTIEPGATATIPFVVDTPNPNPGDLDEFVRSNVVQVDGTGNGQSDRAFAIDTLRTIADRMEVTVDKSVSPATMPAYPGQIAIVQLTGTLQPFPATTVDADTIIVQDPATIPDPNQWFDMFQPRSITATPVPACSTLTVQYTVDGTNWILIPGMTFPGPTIVNASIPDDVSATAIGIRFVYTAAPAGGGCEGGFPPSTTVKPNLAFAVRPSAVTPAPTEDQTFFDCAASSAAGGDVSDQSDPACDRIDLTPPGGGGGGIDPIDKAWDLDVVEARSQAQVGAQLSWSTAGYTGLAKVTITDSQDPGLGTLPDSVYDSWDLLRIDPITAADDPVLTYDEITKIELFQLPAGSTDPTAGSWVDAPGDPCPAACDGTFPGYTLAAADRAVTVGFRLTYAESPTRSQRLDATAPPVGTGVAPSTGNNRHIHPVFELRDVLRSNASTAVTAARLYNTAGEGEIDNTVRATGYFDPIVPVLTATDDDTIQLLDVPITVNSGKTWTGGPLGIPDPGVPQSEWPTAVVSLTGTNTTPARIDRLAIADDTAGTMFDAFNLTGFTAITAPADIGATDVTITLTGPGTTSTLYTLSQALALTEGQLADVTRVDVVYTGRVAIDATATVTLGTRLRTESRASGTAPAPGTTIDNQVTVTGSSPDAYPDLPVATSTATATTDLVAQGLAVTATKSITPASQTEPDDSPVIVTIGGQPAGPSRTVQMVLTDDDPRLWNQYDLVALNDVAFIFPIDRVQVDALTGGAWSVGPGGNPTLTGGSWQTGESTAGPALTLPLDVQPADVQGLRFTFTRADGTNWENPANPNQTISFQVQRRADLHTGGPVPSDLAGSTAAPGETVAGRATNQQTATVTSSDVDGLGRPLTASADATATIDYLHAVNSVAVSKAPDGSTLPPGQAFTYTLVSTNDGNVDITNPVITDIFPSDGDGPQVELADPPGYTYAITGGTGMPTDPADVAVDATPAGLTFTFPPGSTLPIGATYTITFQATLRPGLPAGTAFTNTFGITGDRPWDDCGGTLDEPTGQCRADATDTVLSAGALSVRKLVRAEGSDVLGVTVDPSAATETDCTADTDGFYARPCVPIAEPGGDVTWRLRFVNSGNRPIDRILGIDLLPQPGDTLATAPILDRGSQWRPLLAGPRPELVDPAFGTLTVYYTTGVASCDGPTGADGLLLCPALDWVEWPSGAALPVPADTVNGLQFEIIPAETFEPAATTDVDVEMLAPAIDPTADYSAPQTDPDGVAYNTVGATGRYVGETTGYTLVTEPPRVGVALARGPLTIEKTVTGAGAHWAPATFDVQLTCVSAGETVPLPDELPLHPDANVELTPGVPRTIDNLPWGAECTLTEPDQGQTSSTSQSATVVREDQTIATATITNDYELAALAVTKSLDSAAVDANGVPVTYGPFIVAVQCTYLDARVYAIGYGPERPMVAVLDAGDTVTFSGLPARATCLVEETDAKDATSTSITVVSPSGTTTADGRVTPVELQPGTTTVTFTNSFTVGAVNLTKLVTGDAAAAFGAGPFTLSMTCTLSDASGPRTVWQGTIVLGGGNPLSATVANLATGAVCQVQEIGDGGATSSSIDPGDGTVTVGDGTTVTVTATNRFDPAQVIVDKIVTGSNTGAAPATFTVQVDCTVDGQPLAGFPVTVTVSPGSPATIATLDGATCTAVETNSGAAASVTYSPARTDGGSGSGAVTPTNGAPATITVTNQYDGGSLPITGGQLAGLVAWATTVLGLGAALIVAGARRRRRSAG